MIAPWGETEGTPKSHRAPTISEEGGILGRPVYGGNRSAGRRWSPNERNPRRLLLPSESIEEWFRVAAAFLDGQSGPDDEVLASCAKRHHDAVAAGVEAIVAGADPVRSLRQEALEFPIAGGRFGATLLASNKRVAPEKAVLANCAALAAGGRAFDAAVYFPAAYAACQIAGADGPRTVRSMALSAEIHERLSADFPPPAAGAVACAAAFAAVLEATSDQFAAAIDLLGVYYSAEHDRAAADGSVGRRVLAVAFAAETGVACVRRALRGAAGLGDERAGLIRPETGVREAPACVEEPEEFSRRFAQLMAADAEQVQRLYSFAQRR